MYFDHFYSFLDHCVKPKDTGKDTGTGKGTGTDKPAYDTPFVCVRMFTPGVHPRGDG